MHHTPLRLLHMLGIGVWLLLPLLRQVKSKGPARKYPARPAQAHDRKPNAPLGQPMRTLSV